MQNHKPLFSTYSVGKLLAEKRDVLANEMKAIESSDNQTLLKLDMEDLYKQLVNKYTVVSPKLTETNTEPEINEKDRTVTIGVLFHGDTRFFEAWSDITHSDWPRPVAAIHGNTIITTLPMGGNKVVWQGTELERPLLDLKQATHKFRQDILYGLRELDNDALSFNHELPQEIRHFLNNLNEKKQLAAKFEEQKAAILKSSQ